MLEAISARWQAWRDPAARQERRAARRRANDKAFGEAQAWQRRGGPTPAEVEKRSMDHAARRR
jgi:hypothetical protein